MAGSNKLDWRPPSNLSNTPGTSSESILAHDPLTHALFVVWTDEGMAEREEVLLRRWDPHRRAWEPTENLSSSEWVDDGPLLSFDHQGRGLLIWTRRYALSQGAPTEGTDLMWREWDGTGWSSEQVLIHADSYFPGSYGLIPVAMPNSTLLFITQGHGYRTTEHKGGQWSKVTPWTYLEYQESGIRPRLVQVLRDGNGQLHAAAFARNSSQRGYDRWFYDAYHLVYDGVDWSDPQNLSGTSGVAHSISMVFDHQGRLHFLWSDPNSRYSSESQISAIWERIYDRGVWSPTIQVTADDPDQSITELESITDAAGNLHLAWSERSTTGNDHTLDIYYRGSSGTAWGTKRQVYASTTESRYPTLAAYDGEVSLAWEEGPLLDRDVYFSLGRSTLPRYLPTIYAVE